MTVSMVGERQIDQLQMVNNSGVHYLWVNKNRNLLNSELLTERHFIYWCKFAVPLWNHSLWVLINIRSIDQAVHVLCNIFQDCCSPARDLQETEYPTQRHSISHKGNFTVMLWAAWQWMIVLLYTLRILWTSSSVLLIMSFVCISLCTNDEGVR